MARVSIHAPVRGATRHVSLSQIQHRGFNPRAREGRDLTENVGDTLSVNSFNPRAREGRDGEWDTRRPNGCPGFNPRAREGRDNPSCKRRPKPLKFQSTRP